MADVRRLIRRSAGSKKFESTESYNGRMSSLDTRADFVAVIICVPDQDAGVVRRSVSHLQDLLVPEGRIPVREFRVTNLIQLRCAFVSIKNEALKRGTPLIHIEMHASEERGVELILGGLIQP
jgi:hypothetical protein